MQIDPKAGAFKLCQLEVEPCFIMFDPENCTQEKNFGEVVPMEDNILIKTQRRAA